VVGPGEVPLDTLFARDENMPMSRFLLAAHTACSALHLLTLFLKLEKNWKKMKIHPVAVSKYNTFFARFQEFPGLDWLHWLAFLCRYLTNSCPEYNQGGDICICIYIYIINYN